MRFTPGARDIAPRYVTGASRPASGKNPRRNSGFKETHNFCLSIGPCFRFFESTPSMVALIAPGVPATGQKGTPRCEPWPSPPPARKPSREAVPPCSACAPCRPRAVARSRRSTPGSHPDRRRTIAKRRLNSTSAKQLTAECVAVGSRARVRASVGEDVAHAEARAREQAGRRALDARVIA